MKKSLIEHLPKFYGRSDESPHQHLEQFTLICAVMKHVGTSKDIEIKTFFICL